MSSFQGRRTTIPTERGLELELTGVMDLTLLDVVREKAADLFTDRVIVESESTSRNYHVTTTLQHLAD